MTLETMPGARRPWNIATEMAGGKRLSLKYTVSAIPPSLNRFAGRQNCWEYRQLKQQWKVLVMASCRPRPVKPLEKAVVTLTYFFPDKRRRDPDNYNGKLILDGLTAAGVIKDDSFDCIKLLLCGECGRDRPRTEITITEG